MRALSEPIADDGGAGVTMSPMAVAPSCSVRPSTLGELMLMVSEKNLFKILESISTTNCSTIGLP